MPDLHLDPVTLTQSLIRCPSVTPEEGGALNLLQSTLESLGFECKRKTFSESGTPDVDNLYARLGKGDPHLCFAGHTDVVPPGDLNLWTHNPFEGVIHNGSLFGRGASDMKGAICSYISALSKLVSSKGTLDRGSVSLLITGDEEGPSINGTKKMLEWLSQQGERFDGCLVGEPTNTKYLGEEIKIGRRGSLTGQIIVQGRQGHSAYPHLVENPIPKLAHIIDRVSNVLIDEGTKNFQPSNCQFTVISVPNSAANVIPPTARTIFNIRYNDLWRKQTIEEWFRLQTEAAANSVRATYSLQFMTSSEVFLMQDSTLAEILSSAIVRVSGYTPRLGTSGGTSDARFIKDVCPVVEFGLTNTTIHQVDECVSLKDLQLLTDIYKDFIQAFLAQ